MRHFTFYEKVGIWLFSLFLISFLFQGCFCTNYYQLTGNVSHIAAFHHQETHFSNPVDTIQGPFYLRIHFETEVALAQAYSPLIQEAWAFSCEEIIVNPIDPESIRLSVNKAILYDTLSVPAGTNLLSFDGVIPSYYDWDFSARFDETFQHHSIFGQEDYTYAFEAITYDSIPIRGEITLFMNWQ